MDIDIYTRSDVEAISQITISKGLRQNRKSDIVTVGVFLGGKDSRQGRIVKAAAANVKAHYLNRNIDVQFEFLNNDEVINKRKWSPQELFTYLRRKDIHVIPTHGHQSNIARGSVGYHWTAAGYIRNLKMLKFHLGYPMGKYINCPVFQQDKIGYLKELNRYCTPTLAVSFPDLDRSNDVMLDEDEGTKICAFVDEHSSICDNKFIGNYNNISYSIIFTNDILI